VDRAADIVGVRALFVHDLRLMLAMKDLRATLKARKNRTP